MALFSQRGVIGRSRKQCDSVVLLFFFSQPFLKNLHVESSSVVSAAHRSVRRGSTCVGGGRCGGPAPDAFRHRVPLCVGLESPQPGTRAGEEPMAGGLDTVDRQGRREACRETTM